MNHQPCVFPILQIPLLKVGGVNAAATGALSLRSLDLLVLSFWLYLFQKPCSTN